jgi:signal transduction histidine kinase
MTRLGWYVRARLHRRLFLLSGFSILCTALIVGGVAHVTGGWPHGWMRAIPVLVLVIILWGAAGRLAWGIARPLSELARVAGELGAGKLSSRVHLGFHAAGEVGVLAAVFNDMADRIERQIADQRELLAGVSHELRTPLARIRLLIELLREGAGTDRLDEIEREVVEIDALVGELLASSRLDFSALVRRPLDGAEIGRRALERAGLSADLLTLQGDLRLEADPTLLSRALANLVDNARRHGGGLTLLRVEERGDLLAFEAEDAGPGVPAEDPDSLFRPFAPRQNGEPREPGSLGLGLALVRRIAEAHGGGAYATNKPGGGARIGFEVKRSPAPAAVDS